MLEILNIVAPVFGLIGFGWLVIKSGYVSREAGRYLAEFAFKIAMPALLFRAALHVGEMPSSPWKLAAAYFLAAASVWLLSAVLTWYPLRRTQADGASIAMATTFSNSVMLGMPLALSAFGPQAAAPGALLITLDSPLLWIAATLHIEASRRTRESGSLLFALSKIITDLAKNPIILALLAGTAGRFIGLELPDVVDRFTKIVADGAVPAALMALGMSLATYKMSGQAPTLTVICLLKLFLFPALTFVFSVYVFDLPPLWTAIATLFAAMPVGANAYLFAERYRSATGSVSTSIAISTAIAIVTVSALLVWLSTQVH